MLEYDKQGEGYKGSSHDDPSVVRPTLYSKPTTKRCNFLKDNDDHFKGVQVTINQR